VLDFGVSKLTVADAATTGDITLSGNVVGTPEYMAPEQVRAGKHADHRIDIYSLGVVFYEMLAGRPPFVGEHFSGLMLDIMQRDPPPLHTLRTDVPKRLAGVIHRALARDLDRRYADMPTYIMAVEAVGRDELNLAMGTPPEGLITQLAMPRLTPDGQLPTPKDRRGVQVAIAVGLGLAAAGTWLWIDMRRDQSAIVDTPAAVVRAPVAAPGGPPAPVPPRERAATPADSVGAAPSADGTAAGPAAAAPAGNTAHEEVRGPAVRDVHPLGTHAVHRSGLRGEAEGQSPTKATPGVVIPAKVSSTPSNRGTRAGKLSVDDF
jgi:serine/threonine-protein kinase